MVMVRVVSAVFPVLSVAVTVQSTGEVSPKSKLYTFAKYTWQVDLTIVKSPGVGHNIVQV